MFDNNDSNNHQGSHFQPAPAPVPGPQAAFPLPPDPAQPFSQAMPPAPAAAPLPQPTPAVMPPTVDQTGDDALMAIKQDALASLTPLVGQIDQSPEEKFKTTMMLIQASDNATLIKEAYSAANLITDNKARAQALIDVINEINYFTQKQKS